VKLAKNTIAPFVDMKALPTTGFFVLEVITKAYSGGAKFQNGDVLLARITPCLENGKTAIADFLDGNQVGFGSTEFIVHRGKGEMKTPFVACLSRNEKFRDHCIQSMVGSSGRQRVQNACFSNFYLALPESEHLLKQFHLLTVGNFEQITKHSEQIRVLSKLRDTLLPKLLSGEMRIPEAEKLMEDLH
jgi:type I restriction enzyme S subunit